MDVVNIVVLIASLTVFGAGCRSFSSDVSHPLIRRPVVTETYDRWETVGPDIARFEVAPASATSVHLVLYRFRSEAFDWRFAYASSAQRISDWSTAFPKQDVIVNATYFGSDFTPSGFLSVSGTRIGNREFDLERSALLRLRPLPEIVDSSKQDIDLAEERNAAQSYPLLISEGTSAIPTDSGLLARRTAVGKDVQGRVYIILAPDQPVSLHAFMVQLAGMNIQWDSVLNLDGGPSTGAVVRAGKWAESNDSFASVPIVLMARHL